MKRSAATILRRIAASLMFAGVPLAFGQYSLYQNCQLNTAPGQAVSGAKVWFLTQPNSCVPGNQMTSCSTLAPLATVYSNATGAGGAQTLPLLTNQYGECAAYLAPALYTVCYNSPYTGQLCYPDQNVGGSGTGGGPSVSAVSPILVNGGAGPVTTGNASVSCPTCSTSTGTQLILPILSWNGAQTIADQTFAGVYIAPQATTIPSGCTNLGIDTAPASYTGGSVTYPVASATDAFAVWDLNTTTQICTLTVTSGNHTGTPSGPGEVVATGHQLVVVGPHVADASYQNFTVVLVATVPGGGGGGGGSGSVTSVATGTGLTGGPITTTGTISCVNGTSSVKGCVQVDGTTITSAGGVISAVAAGGTVTSVGLALPASILTVTGTPVTTTGVLTGALVNQTPNTAFLGPSSGGSAAPTFRSIQPADLPVATSSNQGIVRADNSTIMNSGGILSVTSPGGSIAFSGITSATNTAAAMLVGSGASLGATGGGTITATGLAGGALGSLPYQTGAGATGYVPSPTTSGHTFVPAWQPSGGLIALSALDLATYFASPPPVGSITPNTGAFTQLQVTGAGIPLATGTSSNTDLAGTLALSGGTATYTFTATYLTAPLCIATDSTATNAVQASATTTVLTLTGTGTDHVTYHCIGRT